MFRSRFFTFLLVLALASSFIGCRDNAPAPNPSNSPTNSTANPKPALPPEGRRKPVQISEENKRRIEEYKKALAEGKGDPNQKGLPAPNATGTERPLINYHQHLVNNDGLKLTPPREFP